MRERACRHAWSRGAVRLASWTARRGPRGRTRSSRRGRGGWHWGRGHAGGGAARGVFGKRRRGRRRAWEQPVRGARAVGTRGGVRGGRRAREAAAGELISGRRGGAGCWGAWMGWRFSAGLRWACTGCGRAVWAGDASAWVVGAVALGGGGGGARRRRPCARRRIGRRRTWIGSHARWSMRRCLRAAGRHCLVPSAARCPRSVGWRRA